MSYLSQSLADARARDAELEARGLPEQAFVTNPNPQESPLLLIRRGEEGCWKVQSRLSADELNAKHGVTPAQRHAMYNGSLWGWDAPGADPSHPLVLKAVANQVDRSASPAP